MGVGVPVPDPAGGGEVVSLVAFKARNHPQQSARDEIDDRAVPPDVFSGWQSRFGFTVDAAANAKNAKLPRFWSKETDGLAQSWKDERVYCNPPFSNIAPWVAKAREFEADIAVLLVPANRTEQRWWQKHVESLREKQPPDPCLRVEFLPGRLRFINARDSHVKPNARPHSAAAY